MRTPILFIIFNRPETTTRVFEEIKKAKPTQLFIAADGPRDESDEKNCSKAREIVAHVNWQCDIHTLFREKNLGCRQAVSGAISWFFEHVEKGIILEDDCLPDQSFFPYAEELLEKYEHTPEVMMVNGTNIAGTWKTKDSYFFSTYGSIWGWATWKRAWQTYDVDMKSWTDPSNQQKIRERIHNYFLWKDKKWSYDRAYAGKKDSWDYQWEYNMFLHKGISIVPNVNLIENIGFSGNATHTINSNNQIQREHIESPLRHPNTTTIDKKYDSYFIKKIFNPKITIGKILSFIIEYIK